MTKYATETSVSPEQTLAEIQQMVKRYGASRFAFIDDPQQVGIAFEMQGRRIRFMLPLPTVEEAMVKVNQTSRTRYSESAHQQLIRARWRALLLVIRAKLESIESGIETVEQAFMAQLVLPSGQTMSEWAGPQIAAAYDSGTMPPLLPSGG
jgi:hypothetical protein